MVLTNTVDQIREESGKSVDSLFRECIQMLTKLLKYEFRATARLFLPLYLALIVFALINRFISPFKMLESTTFILISRQ